MLPGWPCLFGCRTSPSALISSARRTVPSLAVVGLVDDFLFFILHSQPRRTRSYFLEVLLPLLVHPHRSPHHHRLEVPRNQVSSISVISFIPLSVFARPYLTLTSSLLCRGRTLEEVAIIFDGDRALGEGEMTEPQLEKGLPKSSIEHVEDSNKDKASF